MFPWWLWVAVGLPVVIISAFTDMPFFVLVGAIFLVIGTAQVVMLFVLSPRQPKTQPKQKLSCPSCHITVSPSDNFCRFCGQRLR